ncbi:MAG: HAD-IC family P-type ATPase, partial [Methanomicrobiales archaeon]|nr:HAD-IC family P-type ATPase [Methanomicrobiales archaeon]
MSSSESPLPQSSLPPHALPGTEVLEPLGTDTGGLDPGEALHRLDVHGPNRLEEKQRVSPLLLLARQFTDLLILVLAVAAVISAVLGEWIDAAAIVAIIILNGIIGFFQEYRAERSLEALKRLTAPRARVIRGGAEREIDARDLVPGDLLVISEGDRIPADARLLETVALAADEAALTGESVPAHKDARAVIPPDADLPERVNMVYLGTVITRGRGKAVVTATGMRTELGQIARTVAEGRVEATPLQRKMAVLGRQLSVAAVVVVAVIFVTGTARGLPILAMFLIAVSLAVAAIPEGLPAVVTITLSLGVQRMARRHAVIRRLSAVETLGAA